MIRQAPDWLHNREHWSAFFQARYDNMKAAHDPTPLSEES